jgi:hypothetical protein
MTHKIENNVVLDGPTLGQSRPNEPPLVLTYSDDVRQSGGHVAAAEHGQ